MQQCYILPLLLCSFEFTNSFTAQSLSTGELKAQNKCGNWLLSLIKSCGEIEWSNVAQQSGLEGRTCYLICSFSQYPCVYADICSDRISSGFFPSLNSLVLHFYDFSAQDLQGGVISQEEQLQNCHDVSLALVIFLPCKLFLSFFFFYILTELPHLALLHLKTWLYVV